MGLPLPAIAIGLSALGTGASVIGAISQGNAMSAMANYQAQVQANNAKIAGQLAEQATQTGEAQATQEGFKQRQQQEAITAGIAAGNIDVSSGSAKEVRTSARELGMLDVEQVRQRAALEAYGYRTQQTSFQAESQLSSAQAGFESSAGWLRGVGALLSGGANIAGFSSLSSPTTTDFGTTPTSGGAPYGLTAPVWSGGTSF